MSNFEENVACIQELIGGALNASNSLTVMADSGMKNPPKLQRTLEQTMEQFEQATLKLRVLAEQISPGVGGYGKRPSLPLQEVCGTVNQIGLSWLHITLKTLLPHCRFQTPNWLTDTLRRLLDEYESTGGSIPFFHNGAVLFIDEHSNVEGRRIYDQDNKGWKAISNTLKGRAIPDDDQYSLAVVLLSRKSEENITHITLMDALDAGDFLSLRCGYSSFRDVYSRL